MASTNAVASLPGALRSFLARRESGEPGHATASDRSLWSLISKAASPPAVLKPILDSSIVRVQLQALEHLDSEAIAQQGAFRRELTTANLCLMVAGVLSGVVLALAPVLMVPPTTEVGSIDWRAWLPRAMGGATLLLGAVAALQTYKAREGNRLQRWLSARSGAEIARLGVFMTIAERAAAESNEFAFAALEVVNRDLLENQRAWFRNSAYKHRRSSDWTTSWGGLGTALAFIGGSGAVIASFEPSQTWIAVSGVVGAAVGAYAVNRESLRLDRANASAYEKAAAALDAIAMRYDTVEAEIRAEKREALPAFTAAITEQLSAEHKRWLEGSTQAEAVLGKLDSQLQRLNAQSKSAAGGNGAVVPVRPEPELGQHGAPSGVGKD